MEREALGYSPTSPAAEEIAADEAQAEDAAAVDGVTLPIRQDDTAVGLDVGTADMAVRAVHLRDSTEVATEAADLRRTRGKTADGADVASQNCPVLKVGTKLDKEVKLRPNRWIKVGRDPKAQLFLDLAGVSREHCALRWDSTQRKVEIKDSSTRGTSVNGNLIERRAVLKHGDRIGIDTGAKGKKYIFVLDLRAVGLGFGDPCESMPVSRGGKPKKAALTPEQRRDRLKEEISRWQAKLQRATDVAFNKEKEYYETIAKRHCRLAENEVLVKKLEEVVKQTEELEQKLKESREGWQEKIQNTQKSNEIEIRPVRDRTAVVQTQLEKLKLKRTELERSLYSERFDLEELRNTSHGVASGNVSGNASGHVSGGASVRSIPKSAENSEMEDEALTDLPLRADAAAAADSSAAVAAPAGLPADVEEELFGDFHTDDSDNEPVAKRPKVAEDVPSTS